jgi:hypothetical protein
MRKTMLLLAVFGLAGLRWGADPSVGKWKLNVAKSKIPPSPTAPKELTIVVRDLGDQYEATITGAQTDGSPISVKWTRPKQGGVIKEQPAPPEGTVHVATVINLSNFYETELQNGNCYQEGW